MLILEGDILYTKNNNAHELIMVLDFEPVTELVLIMPLTILTTGNMGAVFAPHPIHVTQEHLSKLVKEKDFKTIKLSKIAQLVYKDSREAVMKIVFELHDKIQLSSDHLKRALNTEHVSMFTHKNQSSS